MGARRARRARIHRPIVARAAALVALAVTIVLSSPARASYERYATFDVMRPEGDDENLLDHVLVRTPLAWRDEFEKSPNVFRTAEGCFTSGQWYVLHDLDLTAPMGKRSHLDLRLHEADDDEATYQWLQLEFRFPLAGPGLYGVRFRPDPDKARQDFAAMWDLGDATTRFQLQAVMTIEDTFNELWTFRQTRVGDDSVPYELHPFEPALRAVWRGASTRIDATAEWQTPSRRRFAVADAALRRREELWGVSHAIGVEQALGDWALTARFEQVQAQSGVQYELQAGDGHVYRRRLLGELAVRRRLDAHTSAELHWYYQERAEDWRPPVASAAFRAIDRMPVAEVDVELKSDLVARFGAMYNRIGIETSGVVPEFTWGPRKESRAFVGLQAKFGRVRVQGIEGIELDAEPYEVTFHHDKGFLQLQTTF